MPKTTVRFPESLLASLDRIATARGISRNRVIVESCRRTAEERRKWPPGFFSNDQLTADDIEALEEAGEEFERAIRGARNLELHDRSADETG